MSNDTTKACQEILSNCASFQLRRAARLTTSAFNEELKPTGLRSTQITVLLGAGAFPGYSISKLAEELAMDVSTLQRSLGVLEKQALITLTKGRQREKKVHLTDAGMAKIIQAKPYWNKAQTCFLDNFGQHNWDHMRQSLQENCPNGSIQQNKLQNKSGTHR